MKKTVRLRAFGPWVISVVALFVAFSGSAGALKGKNTVDSGDIKPGAVKTQDLANNAVTQQILGPGAITAGEIGHHTIIGDNLDDGSVTGRKIGLLFVQPGDFVKPVSSSGTTLSATCPTGSRLISGGGDTDINNVVISSSFPDAAVPGNNPKTWIVHARNLTNQPAYGSAYALCMDQ